MLVQNFVSLLQTLSKPDVIATLPKSFRIAFCSQGFRVKTTLICTSFYKLLHFNQ